MKFLDYIPYPDLDTTTLVVYRSEPVVVEHPHPYLPSMHGNTLLEQVSLN